MSKITIRHAKNTDNFLKIATCLYFTDPFIYPAAFGKNVQQAAYAISKLMNTDGNLLNYKNIVIALRDEEVCGILLYNKGGAVWDTSICADMIDGMVPNLKNFICVSDKYFSEESISLPENRIEIVACCVMPGFRNLGIGKQLISWITKEYPRYILELDVLVNNIVAVNLYKKAGFRIINTFKGFSIEELSRPECYRMIKEPETIGREDEKIPLSCVH